jgi:hypothetical protein
MSIKSPAIAYSICFLAASGAFVGPSHAKKPEKPAKLNSISFDIIDANSDLHAIHIKSTDKKKWNKIKSATFALKAKMKVDVKGKGTVIAVGAVLDSCDKRQCAGKPRLFENNVWKSGYSREKILSISKNHIPVSTNSGIATTVYGKQMIAECNKHISTFGPTKAYSFNYFLQATFWANTIKANANNIMKPEVEDEGVQTTHVVNADHSVTKPFRVKVYCDPVQLDPVDPVADDGNFKTNRVDIFLSTFKGQVSKPNASTQCKKGRVLARIGTTKAGPVKFRLFTKIGNRPAKIELVQAMSSAAGNGKFHAEFTKWVSVSRTSKLKAKVKDLSNNQSGHSSGWRSLKLTCSKIGGSFVNAGVANSQARPKRPSRVGGKMNLNKRIGKRKKLGVIKRRKHAAPGIAKGRTPQARGNKHNLKRRAVVRCNINRPTKTATLRRQKRQLAKCRNNG